MGELDAQTDAAVRLAEAFGVGGDCDSAANREIQFGVGAIRGLDAVASRDLRVDRVEMRLDRRLGPAAGRAATIGVGFGGAANPAFGNNARFRTAVRGDDPL